MLLMSDNYTVYAICELFHEIMSYKLRYIIASSIQNIIHP